MKLLVGVIGVLLLAAGCAFKPDPRSDSQAVADVLGFPARIQWRSAQAKGNVPPTIIERKLSKLTAAEYAIEVPVTLPASPPESIHLELDLPADELGAVEQASGTAQLGSGPGTAQTLVLTASPGPVGTFAMDVAGYRSLLLPDQESEVLLKISLRGGEGALKEIRLRLRTPPSKVAISQQTVAAIEGAGHPVADEFKQVRSSNLRLDLLQIVTLKNYSTEGVRARIKIEPSGSLHTHFRSVTLNQNFCRFSVSAKEWEEILSKDFTLIPLTPGLGRSFVEFLNENLPAQGFDLELAPGESSELGVFAKGDAVDRLITGGYPAQALQGTAAVSACRPRCGSPKNDDASSWNTNAGPYWQGRGFPGLSESCMSAQCRPFMPGHPYTPELCTKCAEFELGNGLTPWDSHRFCLSSAPGNPWNYPVGEKWIVEKVTTSVPTGTHRSPIALEFDPASVPMQVRYAVPPGIDDPEGRALRILSQTSVQSQ